jgi:hypothetical protein
MWNRRKPTRTALAPAPTSTAAGDEQISWLDFYFPDAAEHPAKRRIRRSNELAAEIRQTGGRHRRVDLN